MPGTAADPRFFADSADLRAWFEENHDKATELWVGLYKKGTGLPGVTWPESVDTALCFGWIDGLKRSVDEKSYTLRFTPRRRRSNWSARNLGRMKHLIAEGLVAEAGLAAYERREPKARPQAEHPALRIVGIVSASALAAAAVIVSAPTAYGQEAEPPPATSPAPPPGAARPGAC